MDHTPDKCPNRAAIVQLAEKVAELEKEIHIIDKETSVASARQDVQYTTIIEMLSIDRTTRKEVAEKVAEIERSLAVNQYQTNKTSNFLDQLNAAAIAKLFGILSGIGLLAAVFLEVFKGG